MARAHDCRMRVLPDSRGSEYPEILFRVEILPSNEKQFREHRPFAAQREAICNVSIYTFFFRSRTIHLEGSEETPAGILVPAGGEYPAGENQDAEVLLMADDQAIRRTPQKLRVYKLMVR